jgi:pimeloyl-ACP methyl ester carboxylesterase
MVTVPTLFVWSDQDAALDRRGAEETAKWVSGPYRFEILPGVSHWIPEERPQEVAALVLAHLEAHG